LTLAQTWEFFVERVLEKLGTTESTTLTIKREEVEKSESHHCFERHSR